MLSVREICTSFQEIFADVVIKDGTRLGGHARVVLTARAQDAMFSGRT